MSIAARKASDGRTRYIVRYYENGRRGAKRQRTFDRRADAERFETEIRRRRQLGQLAAEVLGSDQTVHDFIREWWENHALVQLAPGTLTSYAHVLDKWIVPYLGQLRLRDISRETIDGYRATLLRAGAGAPTVNRTLAILQGVLARAVEWRRIAANPAAGVRKLAHVRDAAIDARTPEEVEAIRAVVRPGDTALVSVLAYEGLRPAEAFALEWRDVLDERGLPRGRLRVERALSDGQVSTTKSKRSRDPELFEPVAKELAELYLRLGRPDRRTLVFPDGRGGHLRRQNWRRRVWTPALAAAWPCASCAGTGTRRREKCDDCSGTGSARYFRPYDLRHTAATLLVYEGRTVNEVAEHLGHADPGFTLRVYGHVYRDARDRRGTSVADAIMDARHPSSTANPEEATRS